MQCSEFSFILKPSPINGGIGVFATHDIEADQKIFSRIFSPKKMHVKDIPKEFQKYCIFLSDEECLGPEHFDRMEIGWFINHSDQPNIIKKASELFTLRPIKAGEEILIDYNQFNEPEHLKEEYFKKII